MLLMQAGDSLRCQWLLSCSGIVVLKMNRAAASLVALCNQSLLPNKPLIINSLFSMIETRATTLVVKTTNLFFQCKASGYQGSTLSSLENNSNFKRTHNFLLQVWEALYREMFQAYCTTYVFTNISDVLAAARCILSTSISENHPPQQVMKRIRGLIEDKSVHTIFFQFL